MTLARLHDRLVQLEGLECGCPGDCDAMYAARLRMKREHDRAGQLELGDQAKPIVGPMHDDDWGGY